MLAKNSRAGTKRHNLPLLCTHPRCQGFPSATRRDFPDRKRLFACVDLPVEGLIERMTLITSRWRDFWPIVVIGAAIGLLYLPLLHWLGSVTLRTSQLTNGALLVVLAMAICIRSAMTKLKLTPAINDWGITLIAIAMLCLWLASRWADGALSLVLLSACLSFAGIISFLFGRAGARQFLPAIGSFFVFGLLVGLVPTLDWPLRTLAARYASRLLAALGVATQVALVPGHPPELALAVGKEVFVVATECNGFGLLTSSLLLATILMFQYRLPWFDKLSLFALAVPIAIVCNFLRIVSICLVAPRTSLPYGLVHETLGVIFYYLGLGLIWVIARRYVVVPDKKEQPP
jgi:exosortase/archaeosortase family protein